MKDVLTTPDSQSESFFLRWIRGKKYLPVLQHENLFCAWFNFPFYTACVARDHNLDRAEDLLRNVWLIHYFYSSYLSKSRLARQCLILFITQHLIWREEHDVDNVLDTESHDSVSFFELFPYWVSGTSKDGHVGMNLATFSYLECGLKLFLISDRSAAWVLGYPESLSRWRWGEEIWFVHDATLWKGDGSNSRVEWGEGVERGVAVRPSFRGRKLGGLLLQSTPKLER